MKIKINKLLPQLRQDIRKINKGEKWWHATSASRKLTWEQIPFIDIKDTVGV